MKFVGANAAAEPLNVYTTKETDDCKNDSGRLSVRHVIILRLLEDANRVSRAEQMWQYSNFVLHWEMLKCQGATENIFPGFAFHLDAFRIKNIHPCTLLTIINQRATDSLLRNSNVYLIWRTNLITMTKWLIYK